MTAGEVETILRTRIKAIEAPYSGDVYYKGMRPRQNDGEADTEDAEVMVLTGDGLEITKGTCVVNIYVPDILTASGLYLRNKRRTDFLEKWIETLPILIRDSEIYFTRDGIVTTMAEEKTNEHFVSLKMKFKVLNNNY